MINIQIYFLFLGREQFEGIDTDV